MLAPTELDLPSEDWDTDEDDKARPPESRRFLYLKLQQAYPNRHYILSQQTRSYKSYNGEWRLCKADPLNFEQVANGVVHPVTQVTITKYKKLNDDPLLRET